ncbi:MAG: hypothetical protein V4609_06395 [Pseudomonadota bacterium]
MIERANDPNASRPAWRPSAAAKDGPAPAGRARPGHAWPFLSKQVHRPATEDPQKPQRKGGDTVGS